MRLPSKVTPYSKSIFVIFPKILEALQKQDMSPKEIVESLSQEHENWNDILDALDCLYALNQIEFSDERSVLHYVRGDSL